MTKAIHKRLLLAVLFTAAGFGFVQAQQSVTIDASQVISTFSFQNSQSDQNIEIFGTSDYNPRVTGAYSLGYRNVLPNGIIVRGKIGMRNAGASTIIDNTNFQWEMQYAELEVGGGYRYGLTDKLGIYGVLSPYYGYLLKANQRLDNEDFDIKKLGNIKEHDFGLKLTPGVDFTVSDFVSLYGEFDYMVGLVNLETGETEQNSYNVAYVFTLGLAFTIQ